MVYYVGDEGKGKLVDNISKDYDIVVRFQGGPNAGHTIFKNNKKIVLHQIPSGIFNNKICLIGHGCIIDVSKLINQIESISPYIDIEILKNNLKIAKGCHIITTSHIEEDSKREDAGKGNGSTKCGISPCYRDKYYREGIRIVDWFKKLEADNSIKEEFIKRILEKQEAEYKENKRTYINNKEYIISILNLIKSSLVDDTMELNYHWDDKRILFEGAQGVFLDIDNPYYPNVSSSSVSVGGVITGTGISFKQLKDCKVIGIVKAYMSSVGVGYFPTEIKDKFEGEIVGKNYTFTAEQLREAGQEYGATTGRPRKVGFLDLPMIKYACDTIGVDEIYLTRLDILMKAFPIEQYPYIPICTGYGFKNKDNTISTSNIYTWYDIVQGNIVPIYQWVKNWKSVTDQDFDKFIDYIEQQIGVKITKVSYGINDYDVITRHGNDVLTTFIDGKGISIGKTTGYFTNGKE